MPKRDLNSLIANSRPERPAINRGQGYTLSTSTAPTPAQAEPEEQQQPQTAKPAGKVGRPKGPEKTKKTLYFTRPENFQLIQKALVKHGDTLIKDESELADLALAVLAGMVSDVSKVETILDVYKAEIKSTS